MLEYVKYRYSHDVAQIMSLPDQGLDQSKKLIEGRTQEEVLVPMEVVGEVGVQDDPYFDNECSD